MKSIYFLFFIVFMSIAASAQSTVDITIDNVRSSNGVCCVVLFSDAKAFPGNYSKAVKGKVIKAVKGANKVQFSDVPAGVYAIAVVHDENEDGKLNTNFIGIPKEGYGASNNDLPMMSAPNFSGSSFKVAGKEQALNIHLRYY